MPKPKFQMPFKCHQKWRASTRDEHSPDADSIDLIRVGGASAGQPVYASAGGTVIEAHDTNSETPPYGSVVIIDHGDSWKTWYVHLDDNLAVSVNQKVVRGQKLGVVGNIANLTPHLHYTQLQSDKAVRVTFDGVEINVHAGARKPDGTYPQQDLVSANCPTGITIKNIANGGGVTCNAGAGLRVTVECLNPQNDYSYVKYGPWVGAKETSTAKSNSAGHQIVDRGFEIS